MSIPNENVQQFETHDIPQITVHNMASLVNQAFLKCLFKEDEDKSNYVRVEGITNTFGLHPQRLEEQREIVTALVAELPPIFKEGYSFLKLCENKNGEQWTGLQRTMQELMVMAVGLELMSYCLPREVWPVLPGGVPYVIVN